MPNADGFRALIARLSNGDDVEEAARRIVEEYGPHLRAIIRRRLHPRMRSIFDSDDFMQSVWGSLARMGPRLNGVNDSEQLVALLTAIASNKVIEQLRFRIVTREQKAPPHLMPINVTRFELEKADKLPHPVLLPRASQVAVAREHWRQLLDGESELGKKFLELRLAGSSNEEIAQELGIGLRTVGRILQRLRKNEARGRDAVQRKAPRNDVVK
jgi:RNA polymerase sigma-70 factor (ECF subfamily)